MEIDVSEDFVDYTTDDSTRNTSSDNGEEEDFGKQSCVGDKEEGTEAEDTGQLSAADFVNKEFDSDDKAYELYVKYARCVGFGVQKGDVARDDNDLLIRRYFVCNRAGLRDPKHYMRIDRKKEHKP